MDDPLVRAYREVAGCAAQLGASDLPLTPTSLESIRCSHAEEAPAAFIPSSRIELYPEIAAQLAGYINSPHRTQGNIILIDVGAGTLDVSTAILHGDQQEDILSFHHCEVGPFGAFKLLEKRIGVLQQINDPAVGMRIKDFQSGLKPIPESAEEILPQYGRIPLGILAEFNKASKEFAEQAVNLALSCAIRFRKLQRDVHLDASFDPWPGQVRFFFTGGGSRLPFYRRYFIEGIFETELTRFTRWKLNAADRRRHGQGLRLEPLPVPPELQGLPAGMAVDFDRLSVAHGLAYGTSNLMKTTASPNS